MTVDNTDVAGAEARARREARGRERGEAPTHKKTQDMGPTQQEVDSWAEREKRRRQQWLEGPSEEEKRIWAGQERLRRSPLSYLTEPDPETLELERRYRRDAILAAEGLTFSLFGLPSRLLAGMIQSGRLWEEEYMGGARRPRVTLHEDDL